MHTCQVISQKTASNSPHEHKVNTKYSLASSAWEWYQGKVGASDNNSFTHYGLLEQINTTRDTSDYLWYSISISVNGGFLLNHDIEALLNVVSLGHTELLFINKKLAGFGYGNHNTAGFVINKTITLNQGNNSLDILSMLVGVQNYGPWFDIAGAGIFSVTTVNFLNVIEILFARELTYQGIILGILQGDKSDSLLYGSVDNGKKICWDESFHLKVVEVGKRFHLKEHSVLDGSGNIVKLADPVECKGIMGSDNRHYLLDLMRITPRDANYSGSGSRFCILRPELVASFSQAEAAERSHSKPKDEENLLEEPVSHNVPAADLDT